MASRLTEGPLLDDVESLQQSVRNLALEVVRTIVRQELQRRIETIRASLDAPTTSPRAVRGVRRTSRIAPTNVSALTDVVAVPRSTAGSSARKKRWTREAIINELAAWLASGTTIDSSFVSRHGPRGLVAATRKEFGRFEAALNVASLQVAKLYPDKAAARS
jgi:hypothetical protein